MTEQRWTLLNESQDEPLTGDEITLGWHFCTEFDGLLVGPQSFELNSCQCLPKDHPVYLTTPILEEYPSQLPAEF